jgi:hypothetical protein
MPSHASRRDANSGAEPLSFLVEMANCGLLVGPPLLEGHAVTGRDSSRALDLVPILVDLSGGMAKTWDGFSAQVRELCGVVGVVRLKWSGEGAVT